MRKQISRVWKDLLTVILLVSCRIKTINRIQFLWWVSSGVFSSLTPGSVLAHLPPSVHPSYHPSIISVLAIYWRPPLYLGYALLTEEYGTRTGEKLQSPLSSTFLSSSAVVVGKVSQQGGNWVHPRCLVDGMTEVVRAKGKGKQLFHLWLELRCTGSSSQTSEDGFPRRIPASLNLTGP